CIRGWPSSGRFPGPVMPREPPQSARKLHALAQEIKQRQFERTIRGQTLVANAQTLARFAQSRAVLLEFAEILLSRVVRIDKKGAARFHILENAGRPELEFEFSGIEHLKNLDFMAGGGKGGEL